LLRLRQNLLEDTDCNRVICDNIYTSTPVEVYANQSDWAPFKNMCGHLQEFFLHAFDLGVSLLGRSPSLEDEQHLAQLVDVVVSASRGWVNIPDEDGAPAYANSTRSVLRRHGTIALRSILSDGQGKLPTTDWLLELAVVVARRLQLLIENFSVTLLLNFHIANLEHNGRVEHGRNLLYEMYGDVASVYTRFHDVPGKRWDALSRLLERLGASERRIAMAEIGVEAANTSQRLLERNPELSYIGVDPYINNDGLYEDVVRRLDAHMASGRFVLHRNLSVAAADSVAERTLDLVFLDARHDYQAVVEDMDAWRPKVRPGGILAGHDFSWMFPPVAMAVYAAAFKVPEQTIHLAPDGVWWFPL